LSFYSLPFIFNIYFSFFFIIISFFFVFLLIIQRVFSPCVLISLVQKKYPMLSTFSPRQSRCHNVIGPEAANPSF